MFTTERRSLTLSDGTLAVLDWTDELEAADTRFIRRAREGT